MLVAGPACHTSGVMLNSRTADMTQFIADPAISMPSAVRVITQPWCGTNLLIRFSATTTSACEPDPSHSHYKMIRAVLCPALNGA